MGEEYEQEEILFHQQLLRTDIRDETRSQKVIPLQSHELGDFIKGVMVIVSL